MQAMWEAYKVSVLSPSGVSINSKQSKRLTTTEMDERFVPGHKYKKRQFYMLTVVADDVKDSGKRKDEQGEAQDPMLP